MCVSRKLPHQEITWNYNIMCSVDLTSFLYDHGETQERVFFGSTAALKLNWTIHVSFKILFQYETLNNAEFFPAFPSVISFPG